MRTGYRLVQLLIEGLKHLRLQYPQRIPDPVLTGDMGQLTVVAFPASAVGGGGVQGEASASVSKNHIENMVDTIWAQFILGS